MLCRDIYKNISGYLGVVESLRTLDLVCSDSHGLDVRRDNIVKVGRDPNRMLRFAQLGYNDIFMELYTYYDRRNITMADNCTLYYRINPDVNTWRETIMYKCISYNAYEILSSLNITEVKYSNVRLAITLGHNKIFCLLYNKYGKADKSNLIIHAIKSNNLYVVQCIYKEFSTILDPNISSLFVESCIYGSIDVSKWLHSNTPCDIHHNNDEAYTGSKGEIRDWLRSLGCVDQMSYIRYLSKRSISTAILESIFGV